MSCIKYRFLELYTLLYKCNYFVIKIIRRKDGSKMNQKKLSKSVANVAVNVLNIALRVDANSTSCIVVYQPKAPKGLARFRRDK